MGQPVHTRVANGGWQRHGIVPGRAFQVFGMRRSGNHAIINWLMRNAPGQGGSLFFNNCKTRRDPVRHFARLETYTGHAPTRLPAAAPLSARVAAAGAGPLAMVSYEDTPPPAPDRPQSVSNNFTNGDFDAVVLIYRGFLNWSASLLQKIQANPGFGPVTRGRIMLRAFETWAQCLARLDAPGVIGLNYDDWMASETYRTERLVALGLPERDNSRGRVQPYGGGSSFQKDAARAEDLASDRRAAQMAGDPEYQVLMWQAAHDGELTAAIAAHFPADALRLVQLAETAELRLHLPEAVA